VPENEEMNKNKNSVKLLYAGVNIICPSPQPLIVGVGGRIDEHRIEIDRRSLKRALIKFKDKFWE